LNRACSTYGERRGASRVLVEIPEGRRPLESSRCRWEDNIKMDFGKMERGAWTVSILLRIGTGGLLL
jgi:hypothetical protein